MSQPTRYDLDDSESENPTAKMTAHPRGDYVEYSAYEDLEDEIKSLKDAMERARDILNV